MSDQTPAEPEEGVPAASPLGTLHLLPTAPQELIVEVYWHLVGQFQTEGKERPEVRRALDDLNEAYRALMTRADQDEFETPAEVTRSTREDASESRGAWPVRYFRRSQRDNIRSQGSPWELLHLDSGAPPEVVDLAFRFWHQRLRTSSGDSAAPTLEELEQAYGLLQRGQSDHPLECDDDEVDVATTPVELAEENGEQGSVSALRRMHRAVAGVLASFRSGTDAARTAKSQDAATILTDADSVEEPDTTHIRQPAVGEANESSGPTDEKAVHAPEEETVETRGVPEFLSREASSLESEQAPGAEVPLVTSEPEELEITGGDPSEAAPDATAEDVPLPPSEESPRAGPTADRVDADGRPTGATPLAAQARLVPESGSVLTGEVLIRQEPISLGSAPTCDVVLATPHSRERQVEARIWRQHGRFVFHSIRSTPSVLVNGQPAIWVVLEDGDRLQAGDDVFRFQISRDGATR